MKPLYAVLAAIIMAAAALGLLAIVLVAVPVACVLHLMRRAAAGPAAPRGAVIDGEFRVLSESESESAHS